MKAGGENSPGPPPFFICWAGALTQKEERPILDRGKFNGIVITIDSKATKTKASIAHWLDSIGGKFTNFQSPWHEFYPA